ncbi:putative receptor-like protein kinase At2g23200 [Bidens hawaiensis]|uniref:putative receptor-like protein kinase At2g23200 n=1 Tax=Bidens hawaiensis TaxID=980011 RepID=UPI004049B267
MSLSGQLINICARRLKCKDGQGDIEFWNEISMLSTLKHRNIVSLVGFCEENDEKILVYEYLVHRSLDRHLSGPNLTWFQRLKICLGVAHGLSYIHYDVVHCDVNSSKIYLDKDWEPKISGFELSTKYPQSWRHRLLSSQSFDNRKMTPKYDVYCYGVLLFEVLYAVKPTKTQRQGVINPELREQMDRQSLTFLTNIIDKCLSEHPVQRPTMDQVVKELEDVFELQWKHENLEHSTAADKDHEGTSSGLLKWERPMIPLSEIKAATNNFDEAHFIAGGGFGLVYKGELNVFGLPISSSIEGELQKERTKTSVAIKCIKNRQDMASKKGFLTEA